MAQGLSNSGSIPCAVAGMRSFAFLVAAGLLAASLVPGVSAVTSVSLDSGRSETVVVPSGGFQAYSVVLSDAETLHVDVRSTGGGPMDVYVLNSTNFLAYVRGSTSFDWIDAASAENAASLLVDFRPVQDGTYYVIVDNQALSPTGAVPTGAVEAAVALGAPLPAGGPNWAAVAALECIFIGLLAALGATYVRSGRRGRPWIRRSWTGPRPAPRVPPAPPAEYNAFSDTSREE